jgi:hypothetical protein
LTIWAELKRLRVNQQMVDVTKVGDEWREVEPGPETTIELVVDRSLAPELAELFRWSWVRGSTGSRRSGAADRLAKLAGFIRDAGAQGDEGRRQLIAEAARLGLRLSIEPAGPEK